MADSPRSNFNYDEKYSGWDNKTGCTHNRVVLIGAGMVGQAFLFAAMNQGVAEEYGLIDVFHDVAVGNEMDLSDAVPALPVPARVKAGGYELCSGADLLVICAGRPQKPGETRLQMVQDNAKIMTNIANEVKAHGFNGITVIAANPVDIMTQVYMKVTGFDSKKVLSSGCVLDSSRLQLEVGNIVGVDPRYVNIYVLGEHGDSSVSTFTHASIGGAPLCQFLEKQKCCDSELDTACVEVHNKVFRRAYEIINRKKFTNYGIGACLAKIVRVILRNECAVLPVGKLLDGEYGESGVVCSVPCLVSAEGVTRSFEFPLSDAEKAKFKKSCATVREIFQSLEL